ncbi:sulfatase [Echinicola pacifica]|uniref:Sulfatase n=1 Tax=Echinicola pacifica TaxID=346377 RepID=A0A918PVX0_9BACT|nr:sulfatase [Echinicola pacifica]GGZ24967.1 sulfatase [Echinicola pacifica]
MSSKAILSKFKIHYFLLIFVSNMAMGQSSPPNIVFFFVDDMGWQDTSVPFYERITELNKRYHTPNMERLASEGMKFTQAYASAVCSPSRVSWITGANAARHQVTNWTLKRDQSPDGPDDIIQPPLWNVNGMTAGEDVPQTYPATPLPAILRDHGYTTIHVGKAHWGAEGTPGAEPLNLGFDVNIGGHAAGGPGSYLGEHNYSAVWRNPGNHTWDVPGLEEFYGRDVYLNEALTIKAKAEMDRAQDSGQAFFLYLSHYAIHAPWEADPRFYDKYLAAGLTQEEAIYASMIESMDKSLGDIMSHLTERGLEDNTIVVFMSDNGVHPNMPRNIPLRGHKLSPYEGGIRVPLLVKWPGISQPGSVNSAQVIIEDVFPTVLEMAGIQDSQGLPSFDGESFVSQLRMPEKENTDRALLWHYPHTYYNPPYTVLREGDWKLIFHYKEQGFELFNIANDLSEQFNLAEQNSDKCRQMAADMTALMKERGAQLPMLKPTMAPSPYPIEAFEARQ